jgi:hypothetical protein
MERAAHARRTTSQTSAQQHDGTSGARPATRRNEAMNREAGMSRTGTEMRDIAEHQITPRRR